MADFVGSEEQARAIQIQRRFVDMGDGTHAPKFVADTVAADAPVAQGALTDRSGTITTGGTSQQLAAANTSRRYLFVQNLSAENEWVNFGVAAVQDQPSVRLEPGDSLVFEGSFVTTQAVNVVAATTGSKFVGKEG